MTACKAPNNSAGLMYQTQIPSLEDSYVFFMHGVPCIKKNSICTIAGFPFVLIMRIFDLQIQRTKTAKWKAWKLAELTKS